MTISNPQASVTVQGDGVTTQFSYQFLIPAAQDVVVSITDTLVSPAVTSVVAPGLYTITGLGLSEGGLVTYPLSGTPIAAGFEITIARTLLIIQTAAIGNQGNFYPSVVEGALDYLTMVCQDLQSEVNDLTRADIEVISSITNSVATVALLKAATVSAPLVGTSIYLQGYHAANDGGGGMFLITNVNPGADNGGTIIWSNTSGFYYTRLVNGDPYSVLWFGAKGDGATDDTAAIQAAINAATVGGLTGHQVWFPTRVLPYKITSSLSVTSPCTLQGESVGGVRVYANPLFGYGGAEIIFVNNSVSDRFDPGSFAIQAIYGAVNSEGFSSLQINNLGISWTGNHAGGIYIQGAAGVGVANCYLTGGLDNYNAATQDGFAIYLNDAIVSYIRDCTIRYVGFGLVSEGLFNSDLISGNNFTNVLQLCFCIRGKVFGSVQSVISNNNSTTALGFLWISGAVSSIVVQQNTIEAVTTFPLVVTNVDYFDSSVGSIPKNIHIDENAFIASPVGLGSPGPVMQLKCIGGSVTRNVVTLPQINTSWFVSMLTGASGMVGWGNDISSLTLATGDLTAINFIDPPTSLVKTTTASTASMFPNTGTLFLNPASPYALTRLSDGHIGQIVAIYNQSSQLVTVVHDGTHFALNDNANALLPSVGYGLQVQCLDGTTWMQTGNLFPSSPLLTKSTTTSTVTVFPNIATIFLAPGTPYSLTTLSGGSVGQLIALYNQTSNAVTVVNGATMALQGSANVTLTTTGSTLQMQCLDGTTWVQTGTRTA